MPFHREIVASLPRVLGTGVLAVAVLVGGSRAAFAVHPWLARRPPVMPPAAHQLRDVGRWPAEPASPADLNPERFRLSVAHLCAHRRFNDAQLGATPSVEAKAVDGSLGDGATREDQAPEGKTPKGKTPEGKIAEGQGPEGKGHEKKGRGRKSSVSKASENKASGGPFTESKVAEAATNAASIGDLARAAAEEAGVDPFLLVGLMFEQSGCHASLQTPLGTGLLRISPALYHSPGAPPPPGDRADWTTAALLDPATNLRLGAKLLRMWQDTHVEEDAIFHGVPHRGPAAHFIWGDVVRSSGGEDQALTARRRLIDFYAQAPEATTQTSLGLTIISPLEGAPRVASSGPGEDRAGGKRRHRGLDLAAAIGEPVRAVADGTVIFAGANIPGAPRRSLSPAVIERYRWRRLGPGGIYVCIEHAPERHIVTCYMHLDTFTVAEGDTVTANQEIGRVGRTGVQVSPPHLHFELRVDDRHVDPARYLSTLCIPPKATQTYRMVMQAKRVRLARAKSARPETQKL